MIHPDQIILPTSVPDEVEVTMEWMILRGEDWKSALAAALSSWPEAKRVKEYFTNDTDYYEPAFILPLPQKDGATE